MKNKKSLAETHPEIAKQWHPSKNGDLKASDFTSGSGKRVWWKCDKGDDHEWDAVIFSRTYGSGCPVCSNKKIVLSNCLATTHPELVKQWHPTKNGQLTPYDVTFGSEIEVWWKCDKGDDHEWKNKIGRRTKDGIGCTVCSGHTVVKSNSLATTNPEIAKQWHPTKNGDLTPNDVSQSSPKIVWWKCDKGDDHEWQVKIASRTSFNTYCPICTGLKVVKSNSLATTNPEIAKQWHPTKNGDLSPEEIAPMTNKSYWWKCDKDDKHEWKSSPNNRIKGRSCPYCTLTPQSKQELTITFELIKFFENINPKGFKTRISGRLRSIDIFIPDINLCIEFDGSYWHKNKREIDKIKSEMLFKKGFKLIRVREEPLKKIYKTDIISKTPYNGKKITNDILSVILSEFDLNTKLVSKIKDYLSKEDLQNQKGLENYIDKILAEKASKI